MKPLAKKHKLIVTRHALNRMMERFGMAEQDAINFLTKHLKGMALPLKKNADEKYKDSYVVVMPESVRLIVVWSQEWKKYIVKTAVRKEHVKMSVKNWGMIRFGNIQFITELE